ncbi:hypothetical protein ACQPUQ_15590 [Clostridium paraputrificum]|uniref:hypothetical protein n=1 Tax=Clostridium paraputrificum TaxID=29363 RepID=UPI000DD0A9FE|nr:hypothetical protein [Clostridium paraputrificum]MDU4788582.1 hypothetical protein [Clostridium sp.]
MSDNIFQIDYSNSDDTKREAQSFLNYFEYIQDLLIDLERDISSLSIASLWSSSEFYSEKAILDKYIKEEISRYKRFKEGFCDFYSKIEDLDSSLEYMIDSQINFVEDNKNYETYITLLQYNQEDDSQEELYESLKKYGLSDSEAMKISLLFDVETRRLLEELSKMDECELEKAVIDIKNKAIKSPEEVVLVDLLSLDKASGYLDAVGSLNNIIATGSVSALLSSKYVGKNINNYKLDIKSLDGQINKLNQRINTSQLGKVKVDKMKVDLERLKSIRDSKITKSTKVAKVTGTLGKVVGTVTNVYTVVTMSLEQYEQFTKNGEEIDDIVAAVGIDVGGILVAGAAGQAAGQYICGAVGTAVGGPVGTVIGGVVGTVGGFVIGATVNIVYSTVVDPILTAAYDNVVEPVGEWVEDKLNDLGDWWDSLWW